MRISELPAALRYLRQYRKMTLVQLAGKVGTSASYLSDIERGRTQPSLEMLEKITAALDMTVEMWFEPRKHD